MGPMLLSAKCLQLPSHENPMTSNGGFIKKLCERNALNFETQVLPASYASVSTDLCRLDVQLQAVVTFAWKSIQAPLPHFLIVKEVLCLQCWHPHTINMNCQLE